METVTAPQTAEETINAARYQLPNGKQVIDVLKEILSPEQFRGFCIGNAIKYELRYPQKNGVHDLEKASVYIQYLKDFETEQLQTEQLQTVTAHKNGLPYNKA